jgi:hypothetical protein
MEKPMHVFISYAYEDREKVKPIYERLKKEGFSPWLDTERIAPGQNWKEAIEKAISDTDVVLVCFSQHSLSKEGFIQKEIRSVLSNAEEKPEGTVFVIPIRLDDSPIPSFLRKWQFADLSTGIGVDKLIQSLKFRAKQLGLDESQIQEVIKQDRKPKKQVFVAMPFSPDMEDTFYYGIQRAVDTAGFNCYRSDKVSFVGDILQEIKKELDSSVAIVADLTDSNPNVYLEVGFAWGKSKPTILIMKQGDKLRFDVQGQKCLHYSSIRNLEEILAKELQALKAKGVIQ